MTRKKKVGNLKRAQIFYTYTEYCQGGEAIDPGDKWTSYKDCNCDWNLVDVVLQEPKLTLYWDHLEVLDCEDINKHETIFVIIVRYSTGNTFGRINGKGTIAAAFVNKNNAEALVKKIIKCKENYEDVSSWSFQPWSGYFSCIESCYVEKVPLKINERPIDNL